MTFPTPRITNGQIAIDPRNGILYYKDVNGNLISSTLNLRQASETVIDTEDSVTVSGDMVIQGNLTVNGDTVSVNVSELLIEDNILILNSNVEESATPTQNAGIEINRGNLPNVSIRWNETLNRWEYTNDGSDYNAIGLVEFLNDVGDVSAESAVSGEYLKFDGTYWVNASIQLGTNTSGSYVQNLTAGTGVTLSNNSGEASQPTIAIGQSVATSATPTFARVYAPLTGNVTGNVTGDLTGNVNGNVTGTVSDISNHTINELSDVVISGEANGDFLRYQSGNWVNDAVNLATDTIGNYVQNLVAGTGVNVTNNSGEGSTPTIGIGQAVGTTDTVTFNVVNADLVGDVTGTVSDISNHAINDLSDVVISDPANGDFLRYQAGNWINDPVNLSTDTVGDYVKNLVSGNGITITNNSGEGATPNISFSGSINDLSDLTITSAQNGQILEYDGTAWVNTVSPSSEPIGHENKADSVISFDESSRQFSIAPASSSYTVWCTGKRYVKTSTETVTIPDTSGLYYIYFNSSGSLAYKTTFFTWDQDTPTAYIYWNDVDNKAYFFADERHGVTLDWATHEYLHRTRGAAIANGFGANNYTLTGDGSSDADAKIDIADGTFFDEDLQVDIEHASSPTTNTWQQRLQSGAYIPVFYRSNGTWKKDVATQFPVKNGGTRAQYNLNTAGTWSVTAIDNAKYGVTFIVATNNLNEPVLAIMGQAQYTDQGSAEASTWDELDLADFPIVEFRPLYKVVFQTATAYTNTPKTKFVNLLDLRTVMSSGDGIVSVPVSDHGTMTGLSDDDHTQYLNETRHNTLDHSSAMASVELNDIYNVNAATPSSTQVLTYNGTEWVASNATATVSSLDSVGDVTAPSPSSGDYLKWNGTAWVNDAISLDELSDTTVPSPSSGDYLKWNGSAWVNDSIDLGTDTVGNYLSDVTAGTGVSVTHTPGEGSSAQVAIGQAVGTSDSPTFAGVSLTGTGSIQQLLEKTTAGGNLTGEVDIDLVTSAVHTYTGTGDFTFDFRGNGSTSLNSLMTTNQAITAVIFVTNTTARSLSGIKIDNTSQTIKWFGGSAPSGNASATDVYTITIIKTGSATYTVFASQSKFA